MAGPESRRHLPQFRPEWVLAATLLWFVFFNTFVFEIFADYDFPDWLDAIVVGAWVFQPMLLATWAAFGPGALIIRLPLVVPSLLLVHASQGIQPAGDFDVERYEFIVTLIAATSIISATTVLLLVARRSFAWHIESSTETPASDAPRFQFDTKYLITLITLCAIALGITSSLTFKPPEPSLFFSPGYFFGPGFFVRVIAIGGVSIFFLLLPLIVVPLIV